MATNQTTNYQLNQWESTDAVQRVDFNADNAKIDAALAAKAELSNHEALAQTVSGLSATIEEHTAALTGCGNCQIQLMTYQGNGSKSRTLTFECIPKFLFITAHNCWLSAIGGAQIGYGYYSTSGRWIHPGLTWSGTSITLTESTAAEFLCNGSGITYFLVVFMEKGTST